MSVDGYLIARYYIGGHYYYRKVSGEVVIDTDDAGRIHLPAREVNYIESMIGPVSRRNTLHQWMLDQIDFWGGDGSPIDIDVESLRDLISICKSIINGEAKAEEVLHSFDSQETYGQDYLKELLFDLQLLVEAESRVSSCKAVSIRYEYSTDF